MEGSAAPPPVLRVVHVSKRFPGVQALSDVSLAVERGEIHCLLGENGAGKSTLIKVISGVIPNGEFEGQIEQEGTPVAFSGAADATQSGIATIHQELSLLPELTVAENIFMGRQPTWGFLPVIDWHRLRAEADALLKSLDIAISPTAVVSELSVSERQQIEIAKAISIDARLLILDEPTSALPDHDVDRLFETLQALRRRGTAIIYITHRLSEVVRLADVVSVLRDGRLVASLRRGEFSTDDLVSAMVGRQITEMYPHHSATPGAPAIAVTNLSAYDARPGRRPVVDGVSLNVCAGEIVSLTGLVGSGCSDVLTALWGAWPARTSGTIEIGGQPVVISNPRTAQRHGLAFVPGDRKEEGLVLSMTAGENLTLAVLRSLSSGGVINQDREFRLIGELFRKLQVRASHPSVPVGTLSGGNQQKIAIGKWLAQSPRILLLDQPTRGIDVGARIEIYDLMNGLVDNGMAILMAATDLSEAMGISDRILVMSRGKIAGELNRGEATQARILALATGTPVLNKRI